jgi:hypothetical protein
VELERELICGIGGIGWNLVAGRSSVETLTLARLT